MVPFYIGDRLLPNFFKLPNEEILVRLIWSDVGLNHVTLGYDLFLSLRKLIAART